MLLILPRSSLAPGIISLPHEAIAIQLRFLKEIIEKYLINPPFKRTIIAYPPSFSEQQKQLLDYADGDYILLTSENSRGFVEGINQSIDIVNSLKSGGKERGKE